MDLNVAIVLNIPAMFYCSYLALSLKSLIPVGMAGKSISNQPRKFKI
jgi:hypothetical protein